MTEHRLFPHGPLEEITPGLWRVEGSLPFPLKRNMTVYRLKDGTLLLHSVVALHESGMRALEALGKPSVMVVPHPMHTMDAPFYKERFPGLRIVAAADSTKKLDGKVKVDATPDEALLELGVRARIAPGMKYTEVVLDVDVPGGRALLFTDLFGHVGDTKPGLMMRVLGPPKGLGVARIVKFRQIADREKVRGFLRDLATGSDLRVVTAGHGPPLVADCAAGLSTAAERL